MAVLAGIGGDNVIIHRRAHHGQVEVFGELAALPLLALDACALAGRIPRDPGINLLLWTCFSSAMA